MERILLAVAIVVIAAAAAAVLRRRRPTPVITASAGIPETIDRSDFADPEAPWLYVLFSAAHCESCPAAADALSGLEVPGLARDTVEFNVRRDLHDRYRIDAVPLTLLVDANGVVRESFLGRTTTDQLQAAFDRELLGS